MECRRSGSLLGRWLTSPQLEERHGCSVGGAVARGMSVLTSQLDVATKQDNGFRHMLDLGLLYTTRFASCCSVFSTGTVQFGVQPSGPSSKARCFMGSVLCSTSHGFSIWLA